jgi:hypothetical protein
MLQCFSVFPAQRTFSIVYDPDILECFGHWLVEGSEFELSVLLTSREVAESGKFPVLSRENHRFGTANWDRMDWLRGVEGAMCVSARIRSGQA